MTGSMYGPVPVTGVAELSVPYQNPGGESPVATPGTARAWAATRAMAEPCAAGAVTVATVPLVAGLDAAAAKGSMSAAKPAAPTSRDKGRRGPGPPDPRAPIIGDHLLGITSSL